MSVTLVSRVCSVTIVGSGSLYPFGTGGYLACYHTGVASAIGSLVTPSVCLSEPPPLVSPCTRVHDV